MARASESISVDTHSSVEGTSGAVKGTRFREGVLEAALKTIRAQVRGVGQICPLRRRRYRNGDSVRPSKPLGVPVCDRRCSGRSGRGKSVERAVAFDGRCVSVERNPWAEKPRSVRLPQGSSSRSIGEEFPPVRVEPFPTVQIEVWEIHRCVGGSYLLQKSIGGMWRVSAGE